MLMRGDRRARVERSYSFLASTQLKDSMFTTKWSAEGCIIKNTQPPRYFSGNFLMKVAVASFAFPALKAVTVIW